MADSRMDLILKKLNGEDVELVPPMSRIEKIYFKLLGYDIELDPPQSRSEVLLTEYVNHGGGGDITVEPLSVTENNTYTAPTGKAYSPVTVNVSGGGSSDLSIAKVTFINSNPTGPYTGTILSHINSYFHDTLGMASFIVGTKNAEVDVPLYKGCYVIGLDDCINVDEIDTQVMPTSTGGVEIDFENGLMIVTGNGSFTCAGKK